jgi:DtxR family Mn-dependent transcriptional regulator
LEHGITDEIDKPLEKALRHPKTCPHGNPIPTKCGGILEQKSQPLSLLNEQEKGIVAKITDEKSDLLRYLDTLGLVPGASIKILERAPFNGPITLKIGSTNHAISRAMASVIQVKRTT